MDSPDMSQMPGPTGSPASPLTGLPLPAQNPAKLGESILTINNLTKRYGSALALDNVSFELKAGEVVGLLGPNGAGKTTLMRILLGLAKATQGEIEVFGEAPGSREMLRRVGAIIETPAFVPNMSGRDCLKLAALAKGVGMDKVEENLKRVNLAQAAKKKFKSYSLGMKQRLAVAQALLSETGLLVLDEPMNGLDPRGVLEMRELITQIAAEGRTVLVSSHQLHEVQLICSRIIVLNEGRKLADEAITADSTNLEQRFFELLAHDVRGN